MQDYRSTILCYNAEITEMKSSKAVADPPLIPRLRGTSHWLAKADLGRTFGGDSKFMQPDWLD